MRSSQTPLPRVGSCVGFDVRTDLPLRTLRHGAGETPLFVHEVPGLTGQGEELARWHPRPGNPFHGRLLRDGARYAFWASDAGWYVVDPADRTICMSTDGDLLQRELRMFGVPATICVLEGGDISLHAAAVEVNGQGILLAGPSRFGKTTLAAAFAAAGHRLLTEDTTRCSTRSGPIVFPGPAVARLRTDVADGLHLDGDRIDSSDDRVHIVMDGNQRGGGSPVPLRLILLLRGVSDTIELATVAPAEAIRDLWVLGLKLPTDVSQIACFERVVDLVTQVECRDLRRPLTVEQLPAVIGAVERHIGASQP